MGRRPAHSEGGHWISLPIAHEEDGLAYAGGCQSLSNWRLAIIGDWSSEACRLVRATSATKHQLSGGVMVGATSILAPCSKALCKALVARLCRQAPLPPV